MTFDTADTTTTTTNNHNDNNDIITVFGYGSLMNIESARRTMPSLTNFRGGILPGWRRYFDLVSMSELRSGRSDVNSKRVAALSIRKHETNPTNSALHDNTTTSSGTTSNGTSSREYVVGCLFDIPGAEVSRYQDREHRYQFTTVPVLQVLPSTLETDQPEDYIHDILAQGSSSGSGSGSSSNSAVVWVDAMVCYGNTDKAYLAKCQAEGLDTYHHRVQQYYTGSLWHRTDILPADKYLQYTREAARTLGSTLAAAGYQGLTGPVASWLHTHFVRDTYCADGCTSVERYLATREEET